MSKKQLERLDRINYYNGFLNFGYIDTVRFAILNDSERDNLLEQFEKIITKILDSKEKISRN